MNLRADLRPLGLGTRNRPTRATLPINSAIRQGIDIDIRYGYFFLLMDQIPIATMQIDARWALA